MAPESDETSEELHILTPSGLQRLYTNPVSFHSGQCNLSPNVLATTHPQNINLDPTDQEYWKNKLRNTDFFFFLKKKAILWALFEL